MAVILLTLLGVVLYGLVLMLERIFVVKDARLDGAPAMSAGRLELALASGRRTASGLPSGQLHARRRPGCRAVAIGAPRARTQRLLPGRCRECDGSGTGFQPGDGRWAKQPACSMASRSRSRISFLPAAGRRCAAHALSTPIRNGTKTARPWPGCASRAPSCSARPRRPNSPSRA